MEEGRIPKVNFLLLSLPLPPFLLLLLSHVKKGSWKLREEWTHICRLKLALEFILFEWEGQCLRLGSRGAELEIAFQCGLVSLGLL